MLQHILTVGAIWLAGSLALGILAGMLAEALKEA